jgi:hypothetical protein
MCDQWHSSRKFTFLTSSHCELRPNTEGAAELTGLWFTAFVFSLKQTSFKDAYVLESDLAPMVDAEALPASMFDQVPVGAFTGAGLTFPTGPVGWVAWNGNFDQQRTGGCSAVQVNEFTGNATVVNATNPHGILNIAPLIGGQHALLGEQGKITAVSTYRFSSVGAAEAPAGGIVVTLRGKPAEAIVLLFATRAVPTGQSLPTHKQIRTQCHAVPRTQKT